MLLNDLPAGQSALVRQVVGCPDCVHRLAEFGIRDGIEVRMFRAGNPCIIQFAGGKVCLRADQMLKVVVDPMGGVS